MWHMLSTQEILGVFLILPMMIILIVLQRGNLRLFNKFLKDDTNEAMEAVHTSS